MLACLLCKIEFLRFRKVLQNLQGVHYLLITWFGYRFVCNAFLAILVLSPLLGLVGTMVVHNRMSSFSDALGHCTFTGAAVGAMFGFSNYRLSVLIFSTLFALCISNVINFERSSADTITGAFSSIGLSFGILVLTLSGKTSKYSEFLIGDVLSVTSFDLISLAGLFAFVLIFWIFFFNKFLISSINKDLALSRQINVKFYKTAFIVILSTIVSSAIKWVGILIVNSLLTLPAASARNIAKSMKNYHLLTVFFSLCSGILGLVFSLSFETPTGATIVIVCALIFLITLVVGKQQLNSG
ncbi:MAG: metal ABC transporter permease [Firmicutes bacterium]|nr:metal ABC transporter permease [Bacillota bacterium]